MNRISPPVGVQASQWRRPAPGAHGDLVLEAPRTQNGRQRQSSMRMPDVALRNPHATWRQTADQPLEIAHASFRV
jgi:hypothetical protein